MVEDLYRGRIAHKLASAVMTRQNGAMPQFVLTNDCRQVMEGAGVSEAELIFAADRISCFSIDKVFTRLTLGALTVLSTYLARLLSPIERLNDIAENASKGIAGAERLVGLLELRPAVEDAPGAREISRARSRN